MKARRKILIAAMARRDLVSASDLAIEAGISTPTARKVMQGEPVTMRTAAAVSRALGEGLPRLFDTGAGA